MGFGVGKVESGQRGGLELGLTTSGSPISIPLRLLQHQTNHLSRPAPALVEVHHPLDPATGSDILGVLLAPAPQKQSVTKSCDSASLISPQPGPALPC